MASSPQISVVLPAYNAEEYIELAIESILEQTFKDFELIVINDGSSDNTEQLIQKYVDEDDRVVLISRENKGLVATLNEGIQKARGEFIARMDADDISYPKRFELQHAYLTENPNVVAVGAQVEFLCQRGVVLKSSEFPTQHEDIETELLVDNGVQFCHPVIMMRKKTVIEVGMYDLSIVMSEDVDLFLKLALKGQLHNLNDVLLGYRRHVNSITAGDNVKKTKIKLDHLERAWAARGKEFPSDFVHWTENFKWQPREVSYQTWGWNALLKGEVKVARQYAKDLIFSKFVFKKETIMFVLCCIRGH